MERLYYSDKLNGHFLWDVDPSTCDLDCSCKIDHDSNSKLSSNSDDEDNFKRKKRCKLPPKSIKRYDPEDGPWIGIRRKEKPLPIYKRGIKVLRKEGYPLANPNLINWPPLKNCSNPPGWYIQTLYSGIRGFELANYKFTSPE